MPIFMCCESGRQRLAAMSVNIIDAFVRIRHDFGNTMGSLSLIERGFALAIPLALAGPAVALIKTGMDAQTQLSIVAGLTGCTAKQMEYYTTSLESMGARFGMTLAESAKGLYYVVSAGYKGADAINVLTTAMQHSTTTRAPLNDVANSLTAVRKAGGHFNDAAYTALDLGGKLLYLRDKTGLTTDELLKVVGGTRSARGALGLLTDSGKAFNDILDKMRNNTGVTAAALRILS